MILAIDQGTTSSRAILYGGNGRKIASAAVALTQHFPRPGWVEHDAEEIFDSTLQAIRACLSEQDPKAVRAVGITNQRETVVLWDRRTGKPVHRAIVWQCRRTAEYVEREIAPRAEFFFGKTGLLPDAYFSASKLRWLLGQTDIPREHLLAGTIDSWLIWKLTDGRVHVTDTTNASRTQMFNIHTLEWDDELTDFFGIPKSILPRVVPCSEIYGRTAVCGMDAPVCAAIGDQQAALFGQRCVNAGDTKVTYGTGCFALTNAGKNSKFEIGNPRLLKTVAWTLGDETTYAAEGSVFVGGALIQWLRDGLGIISAAPECDILAESVEDSCGVVIVPAFVGLGTPRWDNSARGIIAGLTRGVTKAHICRAALEAIAFQVWEVLDAMSLRPSRVLADGGAAASAPLLRFQADLLGIPVARPRDVETTALGAALMAGLAAGVWDGVPEGINPPDAEFYPGGEVDKSAWLKAVARASGWIGGGV